MSRRLTKKEKGFVKDFLATDNGTEAALKNYDTKDENTAAVIASENLRKPKIIKAIADRLPDDLLEQRHLELLNKREVFKIGNGKDVEYELVDQPDTQAVSKGLDMAYKIKGSYAPEKSVNVNIEAEASERIKELAKKLYEEQKSQEGV